MMSEHPAEVSILRPSLTQTHLAQKHERSLKFFSAEVLAVLVGPVAGILAWLLPLGLDPIAQKAVAIVAFMVAFWIAEPIDHGATAILGCYLFWTLGVTNFSVAFSGFANATPWFLFAGMLMADATSRCGLARRIGYYVIGGVGYSYSKLLFSLIIVSFLLNFFIPSGVARIAILAPIVAGILSGFDPDYRKRIGKGLFLVLTYTSLIFDKMIMAGTASILTRGIIEQRTGIQILWSEWFIAYLPAALVTVVVLCIVVQWLYPVRNEEIVEVGSDTAVPHTNEKQGNAEQARVIFWLSIATLLWATDFIHRISPAAIALGVGFALLIPKIGFLDLKTLQPSNFLPLIFAGGALSMGNVLAETNALASLFMPMLEFIKPLLSNAFSAAATLYCSGLVYHFFLGSPYSMLSTSLPVLVQFADNSGFNPVAVGLIWNFAGGGKLFVYQSSILILGYSYGYFRTKDFVKLGAIMAIIEGLLLILLVSFYWPLIGLTWLD